MTHSVRSHLRLEIADYDRQIRRFIPGYEEMLEAVAGAVAEVGPARVLDLGAGTGALSEAILRRPRVGRVTLLDVDAEMLARARGRLAGAGPRAELIEGSFDDPLPPADAFAASLALHHVRTLDAKRTLYRRIFEALPPGGVFVNGDATVPDDATAREAAYEGWADHMVEHGIERAEAFRHFEAWAEEDTYFPLEAELDAMRGAGFTAERVWHRGPISILAGRREHAAGA